MSGSATSASGRCFERSNQAVRRVIAGEVLLVPIRGKLAQLQQMFVLDPVGDLIWSQLEPTRDLGAIAVEIAREFEVSPEQALIDLEEFVAQLCEAGLAIPADSAPEAPAP